MTAHNEKTPAGQGEGISDINTKEDIEMTDITVASAADIAPYSFTEHVSKTRRFDRDAWLRGEQTACADILVSHEERRMVLVYDEGAPETVEGAMRQRIEEMCGNPAGATNQSFGTTKDPNWGHEFTRRAYRCTVAECTEHMHWGDEPFHTLAAYDTKNAQIRVERFMNEPWRVNCEVSFDLSPREAKQIATRLATAADRARLMNQEKAAS